MQARVGQRTTSKQRVGELASCETRAVELCPKLRVLTSRQRHIWDRELPQFLPGGPPYCPGPTELGGKRLRFVFRQFAVIEPEQVTRGSCVRKGLVRVVLSYPGCFTTIAEAVPLEPRQIGIRESHRAQDHCGRNSIFRPFKLRFQKAKIESDIMPDDDCAGQVMSEFAHNLSELWGSCHISCRDSVNRGGGNATLGIARLSSPRMTSTFRFVRTTATSTIRSDCGDNPVVSTSKNAKPQGKDSIEESNTPGGAQSSWLGLM